MRSVKNILPILIFLLPAMAAADDAFTIANVEISHSGEETAISKIKAIEAGEADALKSLLKTLSAPPQAQLTPEQVGLLVESYQLENEKASGTSYSATMTVSFNPDQVKALVGRNATPGKPEVLVGQPVISVRAVFRDIPGWLAIKDKLQKMNFVKKTEIKQISADSADLDIYYQGVAASDLPQAFASYGMRISAGPISQGMGGWILQDGGAMPQPIPQTMPQIPPAGASAPVAPR